MTNPGTEETIPRSPRYESLDLWRALACLAVVAFHATSFCYEAGRSSDFCGLLVALTARGWMGVPIFFVVSGYCIVATIDSTVKKKSGTRQYFLRRLSRIYPPFWAALAVTAAISWVLAMLGAGTLITGMFGSVAMVPDLSQLSLRQWIGNIALVEMWRHNIDGISGAIILGQSWTLCYEVQFYVAAGLILMLMPRHVFLGAALLSLAVIACGPLGLDKRGMMWDGRWVLFAVGIAVYYAINHAGARGKKLIIAMLACGLIYGFARRFDLVPRAWSYPSLGHSDAYVAFSFGLLMLFLHRHDQALMRFAPLRPLFYLGRVSYSIYLIHLPFVFAIAHGLFLAGLTTPGVTLAVTLPLSLASSVATGWLFYMLVERRFMNSSAAARAETQDVSTAQQEEPGLDSETETTPAEPDGSAGA